MLLDPLGTKHDPVDLAKKFAGLHAVLGLKNAPTIEVAYLPAPHRYPTLPKGKSAVYVFALAAGKRVLKVGRVGPESEARFHNQHYHFSAPSTVAASIWGNPILWPGLGVTVSAKEQLKDWLLNNCERWHFFVSTDHKDVTPPLEIFLKAQLGPALEGISWKKPRE